MHRNKELSDKISELYFLREGEFNLEIHFEIADDVVTLTKDLVTTRPFGDLKRLFKFYGTKSNVHSSQQRIGEYLIEPLGALTSAAYTGYHPKLEITHWKEEVMQLFEDPRKRLQIAYKRDKAVCVAMFIDNHLGFQVSGLSFRMDNPKLLWKYKR